MGTADMLLQELKDKNLISPPAWLIHNTHFLTIMGSVAYGVSSDTSDMDIYGWAIPMREMIFPHLAGEITGFGTQKEQFGQWQQHHIHDESAMGGKGREYDFAIYNIVKYFNLCMQCNPNMIDSLFVPQNCILHSTSISNIARDNRHLFLSKLVWKKYKGYAYSQLHKLNTKNPKGKRLKLIEEHGTDTKYCYHLVRLLSEVEQIMTEGDLDLQEKGRREHMKAIRRGEVPESDIRSWFSSKEKELEKLYNNSKLRESPDEAKIKKVLIECLEMHYSSLDDCLVDPEWAKDALREMDQAFDKLRPKLYQ